MMKELFYKLFRIEPFPCASCETLRAQLAEVNFEKKQLLQIVLHQNKPIEAASVGNLGSIKPKTIPWNVRRQMLENEDREKARILRQSNEEFEKELGIARQDTNENSTEQELTK